MFLGIDKIGNDLKYRFRHVYGCGSLSVQYVAMSVPGKPLGV